MDTLVVNLFGGPSAGKSIVCADIFVHLKRRGVSCEMALEYAKDHVWQDSLEVLKNQMYIFGQQQHRIYRLNGKVRVIVTDSPLILSIVYDAKGDIEFSNMILKEHSKYDSLNIVIERKNPYETSGRLQGEEDGVKLDREILGVLINNKIPYIIGNSGEESVREMVEIILKMLYEKRS